MEKVKNGLYKGYGVLRLYREDLEDIISILTNLRIYTLVIGKNKLENFNEIAKISDNEIKHIDCTLFTDSTDLIQLKFSRNDNNIYISNDDNIELLGIFNKIDRILSARENRALKFFDSKIGFLLTFVPLYSVIIIFNIFIPGKPSWALAIKYFVLMLLFLIIPIVIAFINYRYENNNRFLLYMFNSMKK